ncbi:MAG TPA: DUF6220 domain-containing protein [Candidatus Limnocylindria bacterium]
MRLIRMAYVATAWLFLACVVVQFFLAGLGVFAGAENFELHRGFGYVFGWLTLVLLILGIALRRGRTYIVWPAVILVLFALQSVLVALRMDVPVAAALHPVNGLAIFLIAFAVATRSISLLAEADPQGAPS